MFVIVSIIISSISEFNKKKDSGVYWNVLIGVVSDRNKIIFHKV